MPSHPKKDGRMIVVECAAVKTLADGTPVVVPSKLLAEIIETKAAKIGHRLGGTVVRAKPKTDNTKTTRTRAGLIAGVVVSFVLAAIAATVSIWHTRLEINYSLKLVYCRARLSFVCKN